MAVAGVQMVGRVVRDYPGQPGTLITHWYMTSEFTGSLDPDFLVREYPECEITWDEWFARGCTP
jgi:hypothetical protein